MNSLNSLIRIQKISRNQKKSWLQQQLTMLLHFQLYLKLIMLTSRLYLKKQKQKLILCHSEHSLIQFSKKLIMLILRWQVFKAMTTLKSNEKMSNELKKLQLVHNLFQMKQLSWRTTYQRKHLYFQKLLFRLKMILKKFRVQKILLNKRYLQSETY